MTSLNLFLAVSILLSSTTTFTISQELEPGCFESGEIGGSLILDLLPAEDSQECLDICKRVDECEFFTYYDETGDCYIFPYVEDFLTDTCQDCISGTSTCDDLACWVMGSCTYGSELGQFEDVDSDQCLDECQNNQECGWFTYDDSTSTCYIYTGDCGTPSTECDTCYTSQRQCYRRAKSLRSTEMVIIGGILPGDIYSDDTLKFTIESEDDDCYLEPYPIVAASMEATFLRDGKVKSCGGEGGGSPGDDHSDLSRCYDYDPQTNTWSEAPGMPDTRVGLKSALIEGGQWLLAGSSTHYSDPAIPNNSTSDLWDGEKFVAGPTLYGDYLEHQCQVGLDPTHVFFADGNTGHTWILDWDTQEYIQQESMRPKFNPGCGKIVNKEGEIEVVVASDGTSEIFSFDSRIWRTGPDMPIIAHSFGYEQIGDTFVLVGGRYDGSSDVNYDTVYQFDPLHYQWILKPYQLDPPRSYPAVLSVRRDAIQCP